MEKKKVLIAHLSGTVFIHSIIHVCFSVSVVMEHVRQLNSVAHFVVFNSSWTTKARK